MAVKAKSKDAILNFVYSFGASIVILGALFKINHWSVPGVDFLDGSTILAIGLIVEAIIFLIFAFDPPAGDYAWENAYPELMDGEPVKRKKKKEEPSVEEAQLSLSAKLDGMLKDAKMDTALFESLRSGIENFGAAVKDINKTADAAASTQQYGDQLAVAANHMESLNALYQVQLEHGKKQVELNQKFISEMEKSAGGSEEFVKGMSSLTANINNLNKVYGGMLSAMKS